jgi:hypothetical protein
METEIGTALGEFLVKVVIPFLAVIVMALVSMVARKLDKKFGVEIFESNMRHLTGLAGMAAEYAEEKAAAWAKQRGSIVGYDKLDHAVAWMMKQAPEISEERAKALIEAALPSLSLGASAKK